MSGRMKPLRFRKIHGALNINIVFLAVFLVSLSSCTPPVISPNLIGQSRLNLPIAELTANPIPYENRLFTFGAQIVEVRLIQEGSEIEGVYIPVDEGGRPIGSKHPNTRIRALFKKEYGLLDPTVYEKGRIVTIAGVFKGLQPDKIDALNYLFPYFHIQEVFLWDRVYQRAPYPWYTDPWYNDPGPFRYGFGYYWWRR